MERAWLLTCLSHQLTRVPGLGAYRAQGPTAVKALIHDPAEDLGAQLEEFSGVGVPPRAH